jgi:myosin-5
LAHADHYHYINQGDCYHVDHMDDGEWFTELHEAFGTLGFEDLPHIYSLIAGILHLGNIEFEENSSSYSEIKEDCMGEVKMAADCFGVKVGPLIERLTTATLTAAGKVTRLSLTVDKAVINRDAIAKSLFNGLFLWVVSVINKNLFREESRDSSLKWVGILDVFGFENFANNSFEQFCINFANERLQAFFNLAVLDSEQNEYKTEAIEWVDLDIPDNEDTIKVVTKPQTGLMGILDSSCKMQSSSAEKFIANLFKMYKYHSSLKKVDKIKSPSGHGYDKFLGFSIRHYAGKVIYNATEFRAKNSDNKEDETLKLFGDSKLPVIREVLKDHEPPKPKKDPTKSSSHHSHRKHRTESKTSFRSVGHFFSDSA